MDAVKKEAAAMGDAVKKSSETFVVLNNATNASSGYLKQQSGAAAEAVAATSKLAREAKTAADAENQLTESVKKAGEEAGKSVNPFSAAYGAVRKLAYILPGIGIAGIFGGAFTLITELAKGFFNASDAAETLNKALADGAAKAGNEVAQVRSLTSILQDETVSRSARAHALEELQKLYPNYFKNMSIEKSSIDDIRAATDKVTDALVRQAQIKGLADEIGKISAERSKLSAETIADTYKSASLLDEIKIGVNALAAGANAATTAVVGIAGSKQDRLKVFDDQIKALTGSLKELNIASAGDQLGSAPKAPKAASKGPDTLAATARALQEIIKLQTELGKVDGRPLFERLAESLDSSRSDLLKTKIAEVIRNNARDGISEAITDKEVGLLQKQLDKLLNPDLKTTITVSPDIKIDDKDLTKELKKEFKKIIPLVESPADEFSNSMYDIVGKSISNGASAIGDAIGSGGGFEAIIGGLGQTLGNLLKEVGQLYVESAIKLIIAKDAFKALAIAQPELALLAGLALEIAGSAIASSVSSHKTHAFAEGGIVTGPINALVGEAGPEAIIPLSKLDKILSNSGGGQNINVTVNGRLSGANMQLAIARSNKNQGLV